MPFEIVIPDVGESITEGVVGKWHKADGEWVEEGEPLLDFETDKITQELPAGASGVLHISVPEGADADIGAVVGAIDTEAPRPAALKPSSVKESPVQAPPDKPVASVRSPIAISPAARRVIEERGLDASAIKGTGKGGLILKGDAQAALAQKPAAKASAPAPALAPAAAPSLIGAGGERRERMSKIRQTIARRMVLAQQSTATLTTFNEADLSAVLAIRRREGERFAARHGAKLGFMSFFVKAAADALRRFPKVNARLEGDEIVYHDFVNIGIAVGTERGLVVPVLRGARTLSFAEIEGAILDFATRARDGKLELSDLRGGTFTITNGGVYGSMMSTPILNPPQVAILGMHAIQDRAVVVDGEIVVRPMMYLALSYDHRIIDGREGVEFLIRIKDCIEQPERMLLEI